MVDRGLLQLSGEFASPNRTKTGWYKRTRFPIQAGEIAQNHPIGVRWEGDLSYYIRSIRNTQINHLNMLKMKTTIYAAGTFLLAMLFSIAIQAQPVTVDNRTSCTYHVKVNVVPAGSCPFTGAGPVIIAPPGLTTIADPTGPLTWIPGYGVHEVAPALVLPPITVHAPGCGPGITPLPVASTCFGASAEYRGHLVIIR